MAPIIPAQRGGLGNPGGRAKALKVRSISIPGLTLVEFDPMHWRQPVFFLVTTLTGLLAQCGTSILRSMLWEIGSRRWRWDFFFGP